MIELVRSDALELLRSIPDASIDCCVTDPAYESLEKHRARGMKTRLSHSAASSNDWFSIFPNERYPPFFEELYRVLKPARHAYIFCDETTADIIKPVARSHGFWVWKTLVWVKTVRTPVVLRRFFSPLFDLMREGMTVREATRWVGSVSVPDLMSALT